MIKILLYKGTSPLSKLIRKGTRSDYSHVCVELSDGRVVESWHEGVHACLNYRVNHTAGTIVDTFSVRGLTEKVSSRIEANLLAQEGTAYDFLSVLHFATFSKADDDKRLFCAESVCQALFAEGVYILERIPPSLVSPRDISISPMLQFEETRIV